MMPIFIHDKFLGYKVMAIASLNFFAHIEGLELEQIEISPLHPSVKKISLKTPDEQKLTIDFELIDIFSKKEALSIVGDLIGPLINRVSYEFDCPIGEPKCIGMSLPTDSSGVHHVVTGELICLNDILSETLKPKKKRLEALRQSLELLAAETDVCLSLYRFCLGQKDSLARFLSLYHLILIIAADERESQLSVDRAIARIDPTVEWTVKPNIKGKKLETKFTRLRNEIAHRRPGKTLVETRKEIDESVDSLRAIAKKLISIRIQNP